MQQAKQLLQSPSCWAIRHAPSATPHGAMVHVAQHPSVAAWLQRWRAHRRSQASNKACTRPMGTAAAELSRISTARVQLPGLGFRVA